MPRDISAALKSLTLVIPSYNRQGYLIRQINFWKDKNISLIILDGSRDPLDLGRCFTHRLSNCSLRYFHLNMSIEERLGFVMGKLETKYAALLSDDEFFLPNALESCIAYLDANADTVSCKGRALGFTWRGGKVLVRDVYPKLADCRVDSFNAERRLIQHFSPYQMITLWSVMRTEVFHRAIQAIASSGKYKTAAAAEIQISLIAAYSGKCTVINELMWMRSFENKNIWWNDGNLSFVDWFSDPENFVEHERFFNSISNVLGIANSSSVRDSLQPFRDAIDIYCRNARRPPGFLAIVWLGQAIRRLMAMIPCLIYRPWRPFSSCFQAMKAEGVLVSRDDLAEINLFIIRHYVYG